MYVAFIILLIATITSGEFLKRFLTFILISLWNLLKQLLYLTYNILKNIYNKIRRAYIACKKRVIKCSSFCKKKKDPPLKKSKVSHAKSLELMEKDSRDDL